MQMECQEDHIGEEKGTRRGEEGPSAPTESTTRSDVNPSICYIMIKLLLLLILFMTIAVFVSGGFVRIGRFWK